MRASRPALQWGKARPARLTLKGITTMTDFTTLDALAIALGMAGALVAIAVIGAALAIRDRRERAPHVCWEDETRCAQCAPYATFSDASERAPHRCADCALPVHDPALFDGAYSCPRCASNWIVPNVSRAIASRSTLGHVSPETMIAVESVIRAHDLAIDAKTTNPRAHLVTIASAQAFECPTGCAACMSLARERYRDETGN